MRKNILTEIVATMSSSLSPDQFGSNQSHSSPEGTSTSQDRGAGSPLNLGFLKSLTEKRTTRGELIGGDGRNARNRIFTELSADLIYKRATLPRDVAQSLIANLLSLVGKN